MRKNHRRIFIFSTLALVAGFVAVFFYDTEQTVNSPPEIVRVGLREATLAWETDTPVRGRVLFRPAGVAVPPLAAEEKLTRSYRHSITLSGLEPGTRYTYWIDGASRRFQLQTQPDPTTPFSFLMVSGKSAPEMEALVMSEIPDFILSLSGNSKGETDPFATVRSYQPVFGAGVGDGSTEQDDLVLDWGGLRFIVTTFSRNLSDRLSALNAHTIGILITDFPPEAAAREIRGSDFHKSIVEHNRQYPQRPVSFVALLSRAADPVWMNEIRYFSIAPPATGIAVRFDVDVATSRAVFLDQADTVTLKKPPIKTQITCEDCRRLADRGTYEAAIAAYQAFIDTHENHYQVDDACFAIAVLFDEKLFQFNKALRWYRRLMRQYPESPLVSLADRRIDYLMQHSDHYFRPLERFERIKKVDLARKRNSPEETEKLLASLSALIQKYPEASIAPAMQFWLATRFRNLDTERAVAAFRQLGRMYPDAPETAAVDLTIADIHYQAKQYHQALAAYEKAGLSTPDQLNAIMSQQKRCRRNIRRDQLALGSLVIVILGLAAVFIKPVGLGMKPVARAGAVFALLSAGNLVFAWLIREQFLAAGEMALLVTLAALAGAWAVAVSLTLADKVPVETPGVPVFLQGCMAVFSGLLVFSAGLYLSVYKINPHYLTSFYL